MRALVRWEDAHSHHGASPAATEINTQTAALHRKSQKVIAPRCRGAMHETAWIGDSP